MSAIVGRVIHERRERAKRVGRRRPPNASAAASVDKTPGAAAAATPDPCAVEAAVAAAVELEVDERLALRRSGGCFLPCLKGAWLCSALGLALIALGSVMCFFAFHSDLYSRLVDSSSASADAAAAAPSSSSYSDGESVASAAAAAAEAASEAATVAAAAAAANELPVSVAAAARSASTPAELAGGGSDWILRSFLKSLSYLGPTVIGVGAFVIVVSCVTILDRRELIVSALKSREAQMNKQNKDTVYAAVVARYMRRRQMSGGGEQRSRSRADDASTPATDRPYTFIASAIRQLHDCSDAIALRGAVVDGDDKGGRGRRHRSSNCSFGGGQARADDDDYLSSAAVDPTEQPLDALWPVTSLNAAAAGVGNYAPGGEARDETEGSAVSPDRNSSSLPLWNSGTTTAAHVGLHDSFGAAARLESPSGPPAYSAIVASMVFDAESGKADALPPDRHHSLGLRGGGTQHAVAVASV